MTHYNSNQIPFYLISSQLLSEVDQACEEAEIDNQTENANISVTIPQTNFDNVLARAKLYFNSCTNSNENGEVGEEEKVIDAKFESILLSCTSADQKRIKNR